MKNFKKINLFSHSTDKLSCENFVPLDKNMKSKYVGIFQVFINYLDICQVF